MPGNILNADTGFPQFTESTTEEQKIDQIMNYLYMLLEQLRYTLNNLDSDNFNETGLREISNGIARPLELSFNNALMQTNAMIEGISNEYGSQIRLLTDWKSEASESISEIEQTASENAAQIALLAQWKSEASSSLAAVETLASQNESRITALANWQSNTGEGLVESVAALQLEADETGAALELLVTYSSDGSVEGINSAKIAAAVSEEESLIELIADKVNVSGFVTYESLETDGETTINGNNISLIADAYGDSISELTFYKWRYTDDTEEDHTLDNMFRIRTVDNENDDENLARYAAVLQTLAAYEDDTKYSVALKLISNGAMSFESGGSLYASVDTYCTFDAGYNVRINAPLSYADACMASFGGYAAARNSYVFCLDGIYFINSDGNAEYIAGPS